jgi:hypothetical protein
VALLIREKAPQDALVKKELAASKKAADALKAKRAAQFSKMFK